MTQSYVAASYVAGMRSACALGPSAHIQAPSHRFTGTCHSNSRIRHKSDQNKLVRKGSTAGWPRSYVRITYPESTAGSFGSYIPLNRSSSTDHWTRISHRINTHVSPHRLTDLPWTDRAIRRVLAHVAPYREGRRIDGSNCSPLRAMDRWYGFMPISCYFWDFMFDAYSK